MGLSRRGREQSNIWAGFVDAVTTLLMVMMFVLTILTVAQSVLRDTINTQSTELSQLNDQVAQLADALGLERTKAAGLSDQVNSLNAELDAAKTKGDEQSALIATLNSQLTAKEGELAAAQGRIVSFETQVAGLLAQTSGQKDQIGALTASVADLQAAQTKLISDKEAVALALAKARDEIDAGTEAARLAAARTAALQALIDDLKRQDAEKAASLAHLTGSASTLQSQLTEAEKQRLVDAAAAEALREKLKSSDAELTAMTLALEEQRKKAEDTLTLLAAADAATKDMASAKTQKEALLAAAQDILSQKDLQLAEQARNVALLNQQLAALRAQLAQLQGMLDASAAKDSENNVQISALGTQLNQALAQVAAEQRKRAELEAAEADRLQAENQDLAKYRSEFFGQLSTLLAGQPGVRVVGDRFVFSSEVLFQQGAADLATEGQDQIAQVVNTLQRVVPDIPPGLNWIIRVDGHTDDVPLSGTGDFHDNWELSQARALSVVRYMTDVLGFPPDRVAAAGFGQYQPVAAGETAEARALNRRIELKLTER
jgi:chemotaxis protein MotB